MRRFRKRRRKPELNAQINVTNLVDVALTILIVFMLIAPLIEHSIPVNLPKADEKKISDPAPITIVIAQGNKLYVNSRLVTLAELTSTLSPLDPLELFDPFGGTIRIESRPSIKVPSKSSPVIKPSIVSGPNAP